MEKTKFEKAMDKITELLPFVITLIKMFKRKK